MAGLVRPHEARLRAFMDAGGLDALVVHSPANVAYLTGFRWWLAPLFREYMVSPGGSDDFVQRSFAAYVPDGPPALVVDPYMAVNADGLGAELWIVGAAPYHGEGGPDGGATVELLSRPPAGARPVEALAAGLRARGLAEARLGVELAGLPDAVRDELRQRLPQAAVRDCTSLLRLVRAVKTEEEIATLARAAEIAEAAAARAFELAAPGRTIPELVQAFRVALAERGADLDHFALSPGGAGIAMDAAHVLRPGDVHFADFGCVYQGYFSDSGTTVAIGDPPPATVRLHRAAVAALDAGAACLRPGVAASSVQEAMQAALAGHGVKEAYPHGHGFGLDVRDYPILAPPNDRRIRDDCVDVSSDLPLEAAMVVNLEAPIFTLGAGAVHCERSFVVRPGGAEPLAAQERSAPVLVAVLEPAR